MVKIPAQGSIFKFNDGSALQVVGGIKNYSGFDGEASEEDTTTLASTAKEFEVGLQDHGGFSLSVFYNRSDVGQAALHAARAARELRECELTLPNATVATFSVFVKSFPLNGEQDKKLTSDVKLRISGDIVWT